MTHFSFHLDWNWNWRISVAKLYYIRVVFLGFTSKDLPLAGFRAAEGAFVAVACKGL